MKESFQWVDPDGNTFDIAVLRNAQNRFAPDSSFIVDESPLVAGSIVRNIRHNSRRLVLPIIVQASDSEDLRTQLRALNYAFDPTRGKGFIRNITPLGTRIIRCYLEDGMGLDESMNSTTARNWQKASLQFFCDEPYWLDASPISFTVTQDNEPVTFFPFFPLSISSSTVFATTTVNNTGDVQTWPRWSISGPGSDIIIRNTTTKKMLALTSTLTVGETLSIDTRPGVRTVLKNDGTNLFVSLAPGSDLFPLARGLNRLQIEMSSSVEESSVSCTYERRWLGA